jgi:hypothetical protein
MNTHRNPESFFYELLSSTQMAINCPVRSVIAVLNRVPYIYRIKKKDLQIWKFWTKNPFPSWKWNSDNGSSITYPGN